MLKNIWPSIHQQSKSTDSSISYHEFLLTILMLISTIGLGYWVEQSSFQRIALFYTPFFAAYFWLISRKKDDSNILFWLSVGLLLKVVLLFSFPKLSDDIFRFVWDGRLWLAGHNPFDHLPIWYMEQGVEINGITSELFSQLNSPEYYTIYPPVAQLTFIIGTFLSPNSVYGTVIIMKLFLLAADIGSIILIIKLLQHWNLPIRRVLWFVLNPLLIIEIMGNLHFEGVMIFFLLLALWFLVKGNWAWSASALALSIAAKLLPLMFLPFLLKRLGIKRSLQYFSVLGFVLIACWLPLFSADFIENFGSSLDLYYRRFEFNASFYYLMRWWGFYTLGNNLIAFIGPLMALIVLLVILIRTYREGAKSWIQLPELWLFAISFYLAYATTIHPWYTALPIVLCIFTNWRWPLLWSGLIWLTYINYSYPEYFENLWIVTFEYIIVAAFIIKEAKTPSETSLLS